jgi:hypothetical protein
VTGEGKRGPEPWAWLAFALFALGFVALLVLGSRPGGRLPIAIYTRGPFWISIAAFLVFLGGGLWSATHRPFLQRRRAVAFGALALLIFGTQYPFPYPSSHEGRPSRAAIELPVDGEWTVRWGGDHWRTNPYVATHDRRWSLHLVVADGGRSAPDGAAEPVDFPCFGREVRAPVDGDVAGVHDGEPDQLGRRAAGVPPYGNHICLEIGEREYLFLSGLARGSIAVAEGARVARGELLGKVGSSATSFQTPEPHLALFVNDSPEPGAGEAIPWSLHRYRSGSREIERGQPRGGLGPGGMLRGDVISRHEPFIAPGAPLRD